MMIEPLIARYGLAALFLGAGLEGEFVVVTGGVLAHKGLVPLWGAMLASAAGSCLIDQLWFFLGRYCRHYAWVQRMTEKRAFARAIGFLERHPTAFIFGFRFIYGLRTISPVAIGTTHVETRRFVPLNILAAAIWGPLFTALGYGFGSAVGPILHRVQSGAIYAAAAAAIVGAVIVAVVRFVQTRAAPRA